MAIDGLKLNGHAVLVPTEISAPIFERAKLASAVQQLARQVPLSEGGGTVPVITGSLEADWVGEGEAKPVGTPGLDVVQLVPKKVATIIPFSEEVARNVPYIQQLLVDYGAEAIARAFDVAALLGKKTIGTGAAGTGPFATYVAQTTKSVALGTATAAQGGKFADIFAAAGNVLGSGVYSPNGLALDVSQQGLFWAPSFDSTGRPINDLAFPWAPKFQQITKYDATTHGFVGDWNQAAWGVAVGLQVRLSNQATLKVGNDLLPLWQHNMVGLLLEAVYGFALGNKDAFAKIGVKTP